MQNLESIDLVIEVRYGSLHPVLPKEAWKRPSSCLPLMRRESFSSTLLFVVFFCKFPIFFFCYWFYFWMSLLIHGYQLESWFFDSNLRASQGSSRIRIGRRSNDEFKKSKREVGKMKMTKSSGPKYNINKQHDGGRRRWWCMGLCVNYLLWRK